MNCPACAAKRLHEPCRLGYTIPTPDTGSKRPGMVASGSTKFCRRRHLVTAKSRGDWVTAKAAPVGGKA